MIFNVIGKKNNQTSVSDADREIPTLGSMDDAKNSVSLVFTFRLGFLCLHRRPMRDPILLYHHHIDLSGPEVIKFFSMLNSAEHEILNAHK